jgi:hypothetical protein
MSSSLSNRAMLVSLGVSQWTAKKHDKKASTEVHEAHNASSDSGRYLKSLIAADALQAVSSAATEARAEHYRLTLPWSDAGVRILPSANFEDYSATMAKLREKFERAVSEFLGAYPDYVQAAKVSLNGLFNGADYPETRQLESKFEWKISILPFPDAADFRADLSDHELNRVRGEIEASINAKVANAMDDTWKRAYDVVSHMAERLDAYTVDPATGKIQGAFRDTLVSNLVDIVDLLPALNLTGDRKLSDLTQQMKDRLTGYTAQALRENFTTRRDVATAAADIASQMAAYMGVAA